MKMPNQTDKAHNDSTVHRELWATEESWKRRMWPVPWQSTPIICFISNFNFENVHASSIKLNDQVIFNKICIFLCMQQ